MANERAMSSTSIWSRFYGRDDEMAGLQRAWGRANQGHPQWIALVADSGWGKTRLVQQFYQHLSAGQEGPHPYWPAALPLDRMRLDLNPAPDSFAAGTGVDVPTIKDMSEAALRNLRHPPWLWWALRGMPLDAGRNLSAGASAVYDAAHFLAPHVVQLELKHAVKDLTLDIGKKWVSSVADKLTFGIVGDLINLVEVTEKAGGLFRSASANLAAIRTRAENDATALRSLVIENLFLFLKKGVPVILVLDDVHYLDHDSAVFVRELVEKLNGEPLPLMLVSTCWPEYWQGNHPLRAAFAAFQAQFGEGAHEVRLPKMPPDEARNFLDAFFPGIDASDAGTVIEKTDGNFLFLSQVCDALTSEAKYFDNWNTRQGLNEDGKSYLRSMVTDMETFIAARFAGFSEASKTALEVSSYQGVQFSPAMTAVVAGQPAVSRHAPPDLSLEPARIDAALAQAERTAAFLKSSDGLKEFVHAPYWLAALASLRSRKRYSDDVDAAYRALARDLLSTLATGNAQVLIQSPQIRLLERLAEASPDPDERVGALSVLLDIATRRRLYDAALAYACKIGLVDSHDDAVRIADGGFINFRWGWKRPVELSVMALQTFSHFGFQPPAGSGLTGKLMEACAEQIVPCLQLPVSAYLHEGVVADVPLETLLKMSQALVNFRATFGHMHEARTWTAHVIRLESDVAGPTPPDDVRIRMVGDRIAFSEQMALPRMQDPRGTADDARSEYREASSLIDGVASPIHRDILAAWCSLSRVVFVEDPAGGDAGLSARPALVARGRDLLAGVFSTITDGTTSVAAQLEASVNHRPVVLKALLFAAALAVETASAQYPLDDRFLADVRAIAADVVLQLEQDQEAVYPGSLKTHVIDALLAVGIYCYSVQRFPGRDQADSRRALVAYAASVRDAASRLRNPSGAGIDLIVASLRARLFDLDVRQKFGDGNALDDEIGQVFALVLGEIRLSADGKRLALEEPPRLMEQAVRFIARWERKLDAPWDALAAAYAPASASQFERALTQYKEAFVR